MRMRDKFYVPAKGTAARMAAEHLFKHGPSTETEICIAVDFGCAPSKRAEKIQRAVGAGVLTQLDNGKLDCTATTRAYFLSLADDKADEKPIGEIKPTPPQYRPNVFASNGLSKKHIPNSRGTRSDIPAWSVRDAISFHTKA